MLKIRITFADEKELQQGLEQIEKSFIILNQSKIYKGRWKTAYSNIYLDIINK